MEIIEFIKFILWNSDQKKIEILESLYVTDILENINKDKKILDIHIEKIKDKKISNKKMIYILEVLYLLHSSGINFFDCLKMMILAEDDRNIKCRLEYFAGKLETGSTISSAYEETFPELDPVVISFFMIHEKTGDSIKALNNSIEYLREKENIRKKTFEIISYPLFVVLFIFVLFYYFLNFQIDMIMNIFIEYRDFKTVALFKYFRYFSNVILLTLVMFVFYIKRKKAFRDFIVNKLLSIKIIYKIVNSYYSEYFCLYLFNLLNSGLDIISSLTLISENDLFRLPKDQIRQLYIDISEGAGFSESLERVLFLNKKQKVIIKHGDNSGKLCESLWTVYIESKSFKNDYINNLFKVMEPTLIILIGIFVGIFCMIFYKTIFSFSYL